MPSASFLQGDKYLVLKKKYRQMLHERDAKHPGTDGAGRRHSSPARTPAAARWDASASSPQEKQQQDEQMSCGEPDSAAEVNLKSACCSVLRPQAE